MSDLGTPVGVCLFDGSHGFYEYKNTKSPITYTKKETKISDNILLSLCYFP